MNTRKIGLSFLFIFFLFGAVWGQTPDPPTNLKAKKGSDGSITLTWQAPSSASGQALPSPSVTGYNVYLHHDHYYRVNGRTIQGTKYILRSYPAGKLYLVVRAMQNSNPPLESLNSNEVMVAASPVKGTAKKKAVPSSTPQNH